MTGLIPGQDDSGAAMPLDDFASEVDALVEDQPQPTEILANASSSCATARLAATTPPSSPPSTAATRMRRPDATIQVGRLAVSDGVADHGE